MPMLEIRCNSLLRFVRSVRTADFLRHNGVTDRELTAILAKLGR